MIVARFNLTLVAFIIVLFVVVFWLVIFLIIFNYSLFYLLRGSNYALTGKTFSYILSQVTFRFQLRKYIHRKKHTNVIISVFTSREFQDSKLKIAEKVGIEASLPPPPPLNVIQLTRSTVSRFVILNECNFYL